MISSVEVKGNKVWFEKFGSGPNVVLLIPGPIGTARTDFIELLDGEDELDFDKFTVVAIDPPGSGKSRPPVRAYGLNYYNNDVETFHNVMQQLEYNNYSVVGWSEGAKVALLMAAKYPDEVEALVLVSIWSILSNRGLNGMLAKKSVDSWNKNKVEQYIKLYGSKDEIQKLWSRYTKFIEFYSSYFPKDIFANKYEAVACPVLVIHGDKDPIVGLDQSIEICQKLPNARLQRFANGEHNCHDKYGTQFMKLIEDQILNRDKWAITEDPDEYKPETVHEELFGPVG